jgi:mannitol-1-phosphate 5-dehydrogenase
MRAYVDRKLFIHNLGHAAAAYLGYAHNSKLVYIHEALDIPAVCHEVRRAMEQSAQALNREHRGELSQEGLREHIDDLLRRFRNKELGDTIFRVGRDLYRKLDKSDRIVGALLLAEKWKLACDAIAKVFAAACSFNAVDEQGRQLETDREFLQRVNERGIEAALIDICKLSWRHEIDAAVIGRVLQQAQK